MTKNNLKNLLIGGGTLALLIALFAWPVLTDKTRAWVSVWKDAGVDCLSGHQNAKLHIHPLLYITVDGQSENIPHNTGIVRSCMAEIHVHEEPNVLHVESIVTDKKFTLGQFFGVYQKPINREGYKLEASVNEKPYEGDVSNLILEDKQVIQLKYSKSS